MSRNIRPFALLNRSTLLGRPFVRHRGFIAGHNGPVQVQRFRIVQPLVTRRKALNAVFYSTFLVSFWWYALRETGDEAEEEEVKPEDLKIVPQEVKAAVEGGKVGPEGQEIVEQEAQKEETSEEGGEQSIVPDEQPEDAWFLPLTWPKKQPKTYYKGEDPEWQAFLEFSQDGHLRNQVRMNLAMFIGQTLAEAPPFRLFLGDNIMAKKFWLDFDFPDGPPPEHECIGIEMTDNYIAIVVRTVPQETMARLQAAVWPTAIFRSLSASTTAFWYITYAKVKAQVKKALNMEADQKKPRPRFPPGFENMPRLKGAVESVTKGENNKAAPGKTLGESQPTSAELNAAGILKGLPSIPQPGSDMKLVSLVFQRTLKKNWRGGSYAAPPRGTLIVSGIVEVAGDKGICTLDVSALYEPRQGAWAGVGMAIRRIQPKKQRPRGDLQPATPL